MNPISSVLARIDTIESRLSQAITQSQTRTSEVVSNTRAAGTAAVRATADMLPSGAAPTTFADALATVEQSVTDTIAAHNAGVRNVALAEEAGANQGHPHVHNHAGAAAAASTAPQMTATGSPTAPIAPASATATPTVATSPLSDAVPDIANLTPRTAATATSTVQAPRPLDGLPPTATMAVRGVPFAGDFEAAAARHGVPAPLLSSMAFVESRYLPDVVAERGATGMMQLMPEAASSLGVDPLNPAASVDGAARMLGSLYDQFGSWESALAAYHTGAETVAGNGNVPTERGNTYVATVLWHLATTETT